MASHLPPWIASNICLPYKDGCYEVTNNPESDDDPLTRHSITLAFYDGYGFEINGVYREPRYWRETKIFERRYGPVIK